MTLLRTALIWDINLTYQARVPKSEPTANAPPNARANLQRIKIIRPAEPAQSIASFVRFSVR